MGSPAFSAGAAVSSYQEPPGSWKRRVYGCPWASNVRTPRTCSGHSAHALIAVGASGPAPGTGCTRPGAAHRVRGPGSSRTASRNASPRSHARRPPASRPAPARAARRGGRRHRATRRSPGTALVRVTRDQYAAVDGPGQIPAFLRLPLLAGELGTVGAGGDGRFRQFLRHGNSLRPGGGVEYLSTDSTCGILILNSGCVASTQKRKAGVGTYGRISGIGCRSHTRHLGLQARSAEAP